MALPSHETYCSMLSAEAEDTIYGTATPTETYLLLEYTGYWGSKAVPESDLPEPIKARLVEWESTLPNCKVLFIRKERDRGTNKILLFVVRATETNPRLHAFEIENYQTLLELDITAVLTGAPKYEAQRRKKPIFLVCTHGRRDKCCAKFGLPVYSALEAISDDDRIPQVWQVSHVGGHRFAANLVCQPHGLLYGRVNPENAVAIVDSYRRGEVNLPNLRGRACYEQVAQAADFFLREQTGNLALNAYRLSNLASLAPDQFELTFREAGAETGTIHRLQVAQENSGQMVYQGCALDKQTERKIYRLIEHQITDPSGDTTIMP